MEARPAGAVDEAVDRNRRNPAVKGHGGAIGAGVPRPCNAKRANESNNPGTPAIMNASPAKRVASAAKKGGQNSQCVINHGMTPANIAGATTKNSAEPRTAVIFDMPSPLMLSKRGPADRAECQSRGQGGVD